MKHILFRALACLLLISTAAFGAGKASPAPTRIALLSDIHIMRGTNETQKALHQKHLAQAIAAVNAAKVDLVLVAGDLTENGTPEEMTEFKSRMKGLSAPVWFVPGNHDVGNKISGQKKPDSINPWRLARFEMHWGASFFTRELPGVRVVGMNSMLCGSAFGREERMWSYLEKKLAKPSAKPTLLLQHFPPFMKKANEPGGVYWTLEPFPRQRFLSLMRQGGVKAVLSGHTHTESISTQDGVLYVTTAPVAYGLPKGKQKEGWTLLAVSPTGEVDAKIQYLESAKAEQAAAK